MVEGLTLEVRRQLVVPPALGEAQVKMAGMHHARVWVMPMAQLRAAWSLHMSAMQGVHGAER